jgi:hypothetical protein
MQSGFKRTHYPRAPCTTSWLMGRRPLRVTACGQKSGRDTREVHRRWRMDHLASSIPPPEPIDDWIVMLSWIGATSAHERIPAVRNLPAIRQLFAKSGH